MKNRCNCCQGKFGLVRHSRAFKSFCSRRCVERHDAWLRTEGHKSKSWADRLWAASLSVVPYTCEGTSA